jgi:predicted MFS family arabinose efflux permease
MFGVLSDRFGGRILLCVMRSIYAVLAAVLMVLAATGWLTPAWVLAWRPRAASCAPTTCDAVTRSSARPSRRQHLMGALGLSRATQRTPRASGGALAGAGLSTVLGLG